MDNTTAALSFIETLKSQISEIDVQVSPLLEKRKAKAGLANATAADAGIPLPFPELDSALPEVSKLASDVVVPDQYTGKKMATACREIMQRRKARGGGAITLEDLYQQLKTGGYAFKVQTKDNAIASLSTTLGKNTQFRRVPGSVSLWGLAEWYGSVPKRKSSTSAPDDSDDGEEEETELPAEDAGKNSDGKSPSASEVI
jgi:hypothetical protein